MHTSSFVAGIICTGIVIAVIWHGESDILSDITQIPEAVSSTMSMVLPPSMPELPPPSEPLVPNSVVRVRAPVNIQTPYGPMRIAAGTRVVFLQETESGLLTKFNGRQITLPAAAFRTPEPTELFNVPPPPKATVLTAQVTAPLPQAAPAPAPQVAASPQVAPLPPSPPTFPQQIAPAAIQVASLTPSAPSLLPKPLEVPATDPTAPTPPPSGIAFAQFSKSLLIVDGDNSQGSASVINVRGTPLIVTNAHVLSGNTRVRFRRLNSKELAFSKLAISCDCDLAVATQTDLQDALAMAENVDNEVSVGDAVVVLGNSQGSEVVTEIAGKVVGIGPDRVEVDAKFVEGNSGSPIIHVKSGKVIAIATFAQIRKVSELGKDSQFTEIRRFGYRLDTARQWEHPKWSRFVEEAAFLKKLHENSDALVNLGLDLYRNRSVSLGRHQAAGNPLKPYVTEYLRVVAGPTEMSAQDISSAKEKFLRGVVSATGKDLLGFQPAQFTAYHRRDAEQEVKLRTFLREKFTEMLTIQDAQKRIRLP